MGENWCKRVTEAVNLSGLAMPLITSRMNTARERYGISSKDFCKYKIYNAPAEEVDSICKVRRMQIAQNQKTIGDCYQETMKARDCSYEEAKAKVQYRRKLLDIKYWQYLKYRVYEMPDELLEIFYKDAVHQEELQKKEVRDLKRHLESEHAINEIMKRKGWSREETLMHIQEARKRIGCNYDEFFHKEYFAFNMYNMTEEEQDQVALYYHSRMVADRFRGDGEFAKILKNKELTNTYFSEMVNRSWCITENLSFAKFENCFSHCRQIIYKPIKGHMGEGIQAFVLSPENMKSTYEEISNLEPGILEEYVEQHPDLAGLCMSSVNTIRIVSITSKKQPVTPEGTNSVILYAILRIGSGWSIVDNLHGGGMCALVNLEDGRLVTDGANMNGQVFEKHPISGVTIKGFQIPMFREAIDMVKQGCAKSLTEGYIGWDVAITKHGPVLIEANMIPGIDLLSTSMGTEKTGSLNVIKPFM